MTGRDKRATCYFLLFFSSIFVIAASYAIGNVYDVREVWVYVSIGVLLLLLGWLGTKTMRWLHIPHSTIVLMGTPFVAWLLLSFLTGTVVRTSLHPPGMKAKFNLHNIQLSIERYYAETYHYPEFLIGGRPCVYDTSGFPIPADGDPLVLSGCVWSYPALEAIGHDLEAQELPLGETAGPDIWHRVFLKYPYEPLRANVGDFTRLQEMFSDRYNVDSDYSRYVDKKETRAFMGNLAADHRYENAKWGYPYWLRKTGSLDLITITSQFNFYYKSLKSPGAKKPDGYILMVFGPCNEKGNDLFTTVPGGHELDGRLPDGTGIGMGVPVIPALGLEPDGKPDGVILALVGGWPWEEE